MNITEDQIERALNYLRDSAEEYAYWKGRMAETEYLIKIAEAKQFLLQDSGTQEYKKSQARASIEYQEAIDNHTEAVVKYTEINSLRKAAEMKISWAQSKIKADHQGINI